MNLSVDTLKSISAAALEEQFGPILGRLADGVRARMRETLEHKLPELSTRMATAALEGDDLLAQSLQGVPELWFEEARVRLEAVELEALRATVRTGISVLTQVVGHLSADV